MYWIQGRYDEAETLYRRAFDASQRRLGPEHPRTLAAHNNLAGLLIAQGRYAEAEQLTRRSRAAAEEELGPDAPETLAATNNLAVSLQEQGRFTEAATLFRLVLEGYERNYGPDHDDVVAARANLATVQTLESGGSADIGDAVAGRTCLIATDIVIVNGQESRVQRRMCRTPPSARWLTA